MKAAKDRVVAIDYKIELTDGSLVESSGQGGGGPLVYLHGRAQIVPGVEHAIEGQEPGAVLELEVPPAEAYGERDPSGVFVVPRTVFPVDEDISPGMTFAATRMDGKQLTFHIVDTSADQVVIDTNHPLAGQVLRVSVAVREVRVASAEELRMGKPLPYSHAAELPS